MKVYSEARYRASAAERKLYGGKTVTRFIAAPSDDARTWFYVESFGPTPGARKSLALLVATLLQALGDAKPNETYKATPGVAKWLELRHKDIVFKRTTPTVNP
jgi:hypothetical protein